MSGQDPVAELLRRVGRTMDRKYPVAIEPIVCPDCGQRFRSWVEFNPHSFRHARKQGDA